MVYTKPSGKIHSCNRNLGDRKSLVGGETEVQDAILKSVVGVAFGKRVLEWRIGINPIFIVWITPIGIGILESYLKI